MEKDKENNREKVNVEDVTLPQIKKVVHLVMTKCYGMDGYRQSDLVRKILRKLKCDYSRKAAERIRYQLRNWIISYHEIDKKKNIDSKKGILSGNSKKGISNTQMKKKINLPCTRGETEESNNLNNLNKKNCKSVSTETQTDNQNEESEQDQADQDGISDEIDTSAQDDKSDKNDRSDKNDESNEKDKSTQVLGCNQEITVSKASLCNCACGCKNNKNTEDVVVTHELVDLTTDNPVKSEEDDDMYDINAVINHLDNSFVQPLVISQLNDPVVQPLVIRQLDDWGQPSFIYLLNIQ